ncbi:hypothetical protein IscW_ISCW011939 [Ixodes scapularis]|uniref:Uncharacterized protein n=1 Tax=Ixodes scapularis TaxID=6945 RepID=B7QCD5_IXOSC|nr:hypothetical protein IscW_ISCW011939 [Ixodes scapularis]|eukprot:XP_002413199.1 hypothetical protein IscW_ISCW011939 [Ixodes scapularis]
MHLQCSNTHFGEVDLKLDDLPGHRGEAYVGAEEARHPDDEVVVVVQNAGLLGVLEAEQAFGQAEARVVNLGRKGVLVGELFRQDPITFEAPVRLQLPPNIRANTIFQWTYLQLTPQHRKAVLHFLLNFVRTAGLQDSL